MHIHCFDHEVIYYCFFNIKGANESSSDIHVDVPEINSEDVPEIIIESLDDNSELTVTPAFPSFPTDEEVVIEPNVIITVESTNAVPQQENNPELLSPTNLPRPSQQPSLLDELKYLLKPTNSLSNPDVGVHASVSYINLTSSIDNRLFFYYSKKLIQRSNAEQCNLMKIL